MELMPRPAFRTAVFKKGDVVLHPDVGAPVIRHDDEHGTITVRYTNHTNINAAEVGATKCCDIKPVDHSSKWPDAVVVAIGKVTGTTSEDLNDPTRFEEVE